MSGLVGSLTGASNEFNELAVKDTIKGIRTARNVHERIKEAELVKEAEEANKPREEEVNPTLLAKEIQDEMEL